MGASEKHAAAYHGAELAEYELCVYCGKATSFLRTGVEPRRTYHYECWERSDDNR